MLYFFAINCYFHLHRGTLLARFSVFVFDSLGTFGGFDAHCFLLKVILVLL